MFEGRCQTKDAHTALINPSNFNLTDKHSSLCQALFSFHPASMKHFLVLSALHCVLSHYKHLPSTCTLTDLVEQCLQLHSRYLPDIEKLLN